MEAQGRTPPPLMWGTSVPAYGSDGNQTTAGAMCQAGKQIQQMTQGAMQNLAFLPGVGVLPIAVNGFMDIAQGNYWSAALSFGVVALHGNFGYKSPCFAAGTPILTP
jgi:hypothetical protein